MLNIGNYGMIYYISKQQSDFAILRVFYFHENKTLVKISKFIVSDNHVISLSNFKVQ